MQFQIKFERLKTRSANGVSLSLKAGGYDVPSQPDRQGDGEDSLFLCLLFYLGPQ